MILNLNLTPIFYMRHFVILINNQKFKFYFLSIINNQQLQLQSKHFKKYKPNNNNSQKPFFLPVKYIMKSVHKTIPDNNEQKKNKPNQRSPQLSLKLLFLAYINRHQTHEVVNDCYNAINDRILKLQQSVGYNYDEIISIVGDQENNKAQNNKIRSNSLMQVIEQEQQCGFTQRSQDANDQLKYNDKNSKSKNNGSINYYAKKFNKSIGVLEKVYSKFEDIMFMYKNQIKSIAQDLTIQKQTNKKLINQIKQLNLNTNNIQNKQLRSTSVSKISGNKSPVPISSLTRPIIPLGKQANKKSIKKNTRLKQQSQDQQIRAPPKPFCQQCLTRQKQQKLKTKQCIQQKNKWKQLSTKITNLKNQLSSYEQQLLNKQSQINNLQDQIKKKNQQNQKAQNQQKKKLRSMNTTLRGEKIVLENQVQSLRKKLQQSQQFLTKIQTDNKKLSLQKQNIQSTMKWQSNTIQDLRKNFSSGLKQDGQLIQKLKQSQSINKTLYSQIQDQQRYLEDFIKKLQQVEDKNKNQVQRLTSRINDLENIIQQKNQTIIKLKMQKLDAQNNSLMSNTQNTATLYKNAKQSVQPQHYGTIMTKSSKKDQSVSLNSTVNFSNYNLNNTSSNQGYQQNMIKVLNKKLIDKDYLIQKLQKQNQILKQQVDLLNQSIKNCYLQ